MYYKITTDPGEWVNINKNGKEIQICRICITGDEFDSCIKISKKLDSKTWDESHYRAGLLNKKSNSVFDTEETGVISEWAISKLFGFIYNGKTIPGGFPFDFSINKKKYDVKCSVGYKGKNYIKAIHEDSGQKCILKSDFFFLTYINLNLTNRDEKIVTVDIVGIITKSAVEKLPTIPSPTKSKHQNYEIEFDNPDIISIKDAFQRFNDRKKSKECVQQIEKVEIVL